MQINARTGTSNEFHVTERWTSSAKSNFQFDALRQYLEHVAGAYKQHEEKKPVMLFDIQEQRIYAYGYEGFKSELSAKSQASLTEQYEQAQRSGQMVVFVRDNDNRRLANEFE